MKTASIGLCLLILGSSRLVQGASYWETVQAQNPSGYWRFSPSEISGTTVAPTTGSVSGTLINGVTAGAAGPQTSGFGVGNTALDLENTTKVGLSQAQYLNLGDNFDTTRTAFTFSAWINPESWHSSGSTFAGTLLAKWGTGGTGNQFFLSLIDNPIGTESLLSYVDINTNKASTAVGSIELGEWQHVALVFQGDDPSVAGNDGYLNLYLNGEQAASLPLSLAAYRDGTSQIFIGAPNTGNYGFDGLIDEIAIWDGTALSGEQIQAQYLAAVPEPSTLIGMLSAAVTGAALVLWRRRKVRS